MAVEFNEPASMVSARGASRPSFFIRFMIRTGLVKTERGAEMLLLILAGLLLAFSAFLFLRHSTLPPAPTPEQVAL